MSFLKKPGRILLLIMIVLAVVCPYRVHMYKTKIEEIKSGKLKINDMQYAADDLHPYSAYLSENAILWKLIRLYDFS